MSIETGIRRLFISCCLCPFLFNTPALASKSKGLSEVAIKLRDKVNVFARDGACLKAEEKLAKIAEKIEIPPEVLARSESYRSVYFLK